MDLRSKILRSFFILFTAAFCISVIFYILAFQTNLIEIGFMKKGLLNSNCSCIILQDPYFHSRCFGKRQTIQETNGTIMINHATNRTIYLTLMGRLGNNLFEIASAYALAKDTNSQLAVMNSSNLNIFDSRPFVTTNAKNLAKLKLKSLRGNHKLKSYIIAFDTAFQSSFIFQHSLQRYAYFGGCEDEIREKMQLNKILIAKADKAIFDITQYHLNLTYSTAQRISPSLLSWFTNTNVTTVGIQIRRGDMVANVMHKDGYRLPGVSYFKNAMNYFKGKYKNVIFIVATNGRSWVKKHLLQNGVYLSSMKTPSEDLAIVSRCDHAITSVGTFSWWAGFYNRGTVIYNKDAVAPNSSLWKRMEFTIKERYPPYWIPMA